MYFVGRGHNSSWVVHIFLGLAWKILVLGATSVLGKGGQLVILLVGLVPGGNEVYSNSFMQ